MGEKFGHDATGIRPNAGPVEVHGTHDRSSFTSDQNVHDRIDYCVEPRHLFDQLPICGARVQKTCPRGASLEFHNRIATSGDIPAHEEEICSDFRVGVK